MKVPRKMLARAISNVTVGTVFAIAVATPVMADKIISNISTPPGGGGSASGCAYGFGGWNLDNVKVFLNEAPGAYTASNFDESGCYSFPVGTDHTYYADVDDGADMVVGRVLAKDWPIGEPPGVKVINDDGDVKNGKPQNCIMSTSYLDGGFLDADSPAPVTCSGPYQSHKRYKVAMLPEILEGDGKGVDMVFNVEAEEGERDYQVFQKINNWTNKRLTGFTIEVGFGVGEDFIAAGAADNLRISVPDHLWDESQLANFSAGLFGPLDSHGQIGFYDEKTRAGFFIDEYGSDTGNLGTPTLHATRVLGSNYEELPRGVEAMNQFGKWLPSNALPYGIFFDDDGNLDTDNELVAWYGYNPATDGLGWMRGVADKFVAIEDSVIEEYANSLVYSAAVIDDLVNVGLNYIVTVGDVTDDSSTEGEFTIRITPTAVTELSPDAGFPPYVEQDSATGEWTQVQPDPWLTYTSEAPSVMLQPGPVYEIGQVLTARVGDASANEDPLAIEELTVTITSTDDTTPDAEVTLYELGEDRGVFAAALPSDYSNSSAGTVISMAYGSLTDSTTAVEPQNPPVSYDLSITEFSVPESLADGLSRNIRVRVENDHETLASASGFVRLTGAASDGSEYTFEDVPFSLDPGKKTRATFRWVASLAKPEVAHTVAWIAEVYIDDPDSGTILIESAAASSEVVPKTGKNSKK